MYIRHMRETGVSEPVVQIRKSMISWICETLNEGGMSVSPREWDKDIISYIGREVISTAPERIRREYYSELTGYASYFGNYVFEENSYECIWKLKCTNTLTMKEIDKIRAETTGTERIVFYMAAYLGMTYTEIVGLCVGNIYQDHFYIPNKNNIYKGAKCIIFNQDTIEELERYLHTRNADIKWAKIFDKSAEVPNNLVIHQSRGEILPYTVAAIHYMMKALSKRVGIKFSITSLKTVNERNVSDRETACMMQHMNQMTLDLYDLNDSSVTDNNELIQMIRSNWVDESKDEGQNRSRKNKH